MYRDKDKQRLATRERVRRYRALHKGVTVGVTGGDDSVGRYRGNVTPSVIPEMPVAWGGPDAWEAWRGLSPSFVVDDKADSVDRPVVKSEWMRAKERQMEEFLKRYGKR